jgi:hypothetical protein
MRVFGATVARGFMVAAVVLLGQAAPAFASGARLRWLPSPGAQVLGYFVYVREAARPYGSGIDVGSPSVGTDGAIAYVLTGLDPNIRYYLAVSAYAGDGLESARSNELPVGPPSAGACGAADLLMNVRRLRLKRLPGRLKIACKASFTDSSFFDPAVAGLSLVVSDDVGEPIAQLDVPPSDLISSGDGSVLRTRQKRGTGATVELQRLAMRTRDGETSISVRIAVRPDIQLPSGAGLKLQSGEACISTAPLDCSLGRKTLSCR